MHLILKWGTGASLTAAFASIGYTVVQLLQIAGITHYPADAMLIYAFSLGIAPSFLLAILALYHVLPGEKKFRANAAVLFSIFYTVFAMLVYAVQLASVIPFNLKNEILVVAPHSLFWTIDALCYINMGIAALFTAYNFKQHTWTRRFFMAHGLVTPLIAFVYFYPDFSNTLLMAGLPWNITAPGCMIALALYFKKRSLAEVIHADDLNCSKAGR